MKELKVDLPKGFSNLKMEDGMSVEKMILKVQAEAAIEQFKSSVSEKIPQSKDWTNEEYIRAILRGVIGGVVVGKELAKEEGGVLDAVIKIATDYKDLSVDFYDKITIGMGISQPRDKETGIQRLTDKYEQVVDYIYDFLTGEE